MASDLSSDQSSSRQARRMFVAVMIGIAVLLVLIALADIYLVDPDIERGPGGWHSAAIGWGFGELVLLGVTIMGWRILGRSAARGQGS